VTGNLIFEKGKLKKPTRLYEKFESKLYLESEHTSNEEDPWDVDYRPLLITSRQEIITGFMKQDVIILAKDFSVIKKIAI
jgi:hypothetical protein